MYKKNYNVNYNRRIFDMYNINIKLISCKGEYFILYVYFVYKYIIFLIWVYIDNKIILFCWIK